MHVVILFINSYHLEILRHFCFVENYVLAREEDIQMKNISPIYYVKC